MVDTDELVEAICEWCFDYDFYGSEDIGTELMQEQIEDDLESGGESYKEYIQESIDEISETWKDFDASKATENEMAVYYEQIALCYRGISLIHRINELEGPGGQFDMKRRSKTGLRQRFKPVINLRRSRR